MSPVFLLDASSALNAWDIYPIEIFKTFWEWLENEHLSKNTLQIVRENLAEVKHNDLELHEKLVTCGTKVIVPTKEIGQTVKDIKESLDIVDDDYHKKGVDYNDLLLIATAKLDSYSVISEESKQKSRPKKTAKYKIPKVCKRENVECMNFIEWLKSQNPTF